MTHQPWGSPTTFSRYLACRLMLRDFSVQMLNPYEYGSCRHRSSYLHVHHAVAVRGWSGDLARVSGFDPALQMCWNFLATAEWCAGVFLLFFLEGGSGVGGWVGYLRSKLFAGRGCCYVKIFSYARSLALLQSTLTRVVVFFWRVRGSVGGY